MTHKPALRKRTFMFTSLPDRHDVEHDVRLFGRHFVLRRTGWHVQKVFSYRCNGQHR